MRELSVADRVAIFGDHPKVWHLITDERVPMTLCGQLPDTFTKYGSVLEVDHAMGGGKCSREKCRCRHSVRVCERCRKIDDWLRAAGGHDR